MGVHEGLFPHPADSKSGGNLFARNAGKWIRKRVSRINITTDSLKILQTIILCWWFHSCYYLTDWNFCGIVFFASLPATHPHIRNGGPSEYGKRNFLILLSFAAEQSRTERGEVLRSAYDLWLSPCSLSAFRCRRCYSPYTAICDGTLLKFHPHKY